MSLPHLHALALSLAFLSTTAATATAADGPGDAITFSHGDWELACDNTGTCRVAGYQQDADNLPVSVLLTRDAGAGTPVTGKVALGEDWGSDSTVPPPAAVTLHIDQRSHGRIAIRSHDSTGDLSAAQVAALLASLRRDSLIEFPAADSTQTWTLSDTGASAALLKMDDAQGRIGTVGALQRKGKRDESDVPAARPAPVVRAVGAVPARKGDDTLAERHADALRAALRAADAGQDCMDLHDTDRTQDRGDLPLDINRLDNGHLLVSTRCWLAAYNSGDGYWIVTDAPPFKATLVTADANGLELDTTQVTLDASHKGRGLGDCWGRDAWTWDGTRFVHAYAGSTGMCRGFPGGAWEMPTRVTEVVKSGGKH